MSTLSQQIQQNCHISDAQYAGNYTLCIYLLKMREYYRWEQQLPFIQKLDNTDIGQWLTQRESLWDEIDEDELARIQLNNQIYDPFESQQINAQLEKQQLVYSAGYGLHGKPVFFWVSSFTNSNMKTSPSILPVKNWQEIWPLHRGWHNRKPYLFGASHYGVLSGKNMRSLTGTIRKTRFHVPLPATTSKTSLMIHLKS